MSSLTSVTAPNNNTTTRYYDDLGNMTRVTDPRGKDTYYYYAYSGCAGCGGAGGMLTKVKDALNNETEYRYDVNGRMTKVIDALDRETDYAYDVMGRMTRVTSPSGSGNSVYMLSGRLGYVVVKQKSGGVRALLFVRLGQARNCRHYCPGTCGICGSWGSCGMLGRLGNGGAPLGDCAPGIGDSIPGTWGMACVGSEGRFIMIASSG